MAAAGNASDGGPHRSLTRTLAEFAAALRLSDLDPAVADAARQAVLDCVGCGVAGGADPAVSRLQATLLKSGEVGMLPVFGGAARFAPRAAALVNGSLAHALEMDDTHSFSSVHAGGPIVAAVLAAGYSGVIPGARLLEGVVTGYEIACRLGMAIRGATPYHRGFHPTGICGVFGAASACAKILDLDPGGFQSAWGIAGSMAGGLMSYLQNGAWTKKLQPGWAAQSGLLAAVLATEGYLGPDDIFTGRFNFCRAYADAWDPAIFVQELGSRFEICRMSFKRFACCRTIHGPITAALKIRQQPGFDAACVEQVEARIPDEDLDLVVEPIEAKVHPRTIVEAQFSMPFGIALALVRGDAMPGDYREESLRDPSIQRIAAAFRYVVDGAYTRRRPREFPCCLRVRAGGRWYAAEVDAPLGDCTNPLSAVELLGKFDALTRPVLGPAPSEALRAAVQRLGTGGSADRANRILDLAALPADGRPS